jgi:hypothetical protein
MRCPARCPWLLCCRGALVVSPSTPSLSWVCKVCIVQRRGKKADANVDAAPGFNAAIAARSARRRSASARRLPPPCFCSPFFFLPCVPGFEQLVGGCAEGHDFSAVDPLLNRRQCVALPVGGGTQPRSRSLLVALTHTKKRGCVWNAAAHPRSPRAKLKRKTAKTGFWF